MACLLCHKPLDAGASGTLCDACRQKLQVASADSGYPGASPAGKPQTSPAIPAPQSVERRGREVWRSAASIEMRGPIAAAIHPNGEILVLDQPDAFRVLRLDSQGKYLGELLRIPCNDGPGGVEDPQGLCVDSTGAIYVADATNDRIAVFDAKGKFQSFLGSGGSEPGEFAHPGDVDVDETGNIYVADTYNRRVQMISPDGIVTLEIANFGSKLQLRSPVSVTTDRAGAIYIADGDLNRIFKFSSGGVLLAMVPKSDEELFDGPGDVRVRDDGGLYVSDRRNLRVRRFDAAHRVTGEVDLSQEDGESFEGGDIAILGDYVLIPDRMNDCVICAAFHPA